MGDAAITWLAAPGPAGTETDLVVAVAEAALGQVGLEGKSSFGGVGLARPKPSYNFV